MSITTALLERLLTPPKGCSGMLRAKLYRWEASVQHLTLKVYSYTSLHHPHTTNKQVTKRRDPSSPANAPGGTTRVFLPGRAASEDHQAPRCGTSSFGATRHPSMPLRARAPRYLVLQLLVQPPVVVIPDQDVQGEGAAGLAWGAHPGTHLGRGSHSPSLFPLWMLEIPSYSSPEPFSFSSLLAPT